MRFHWFALVIVLCAMPLVSRAGEKAARAPLLTDGTYAKLRDLVLPKGDELAWQKIPWRPSVWDGIVEGQESDKPILLWIENGHPLGCT